ncbi:S8 family serine peptidase [Streptomyces sp. NPDC050400]|uniref:S8 family serine peptidase n=1 Tax=Streptomyces sp. NPDC050400 TaxID=3365610 RepID=UPI00378C86D7
MRHVPRPSRRAAAVAVTALATLAAVVTPATAAPSATGPTNAQDVLASLDSQELDALHRTASLDLGGLHITDKKALRSDASLDVIVQLRTPPARTARLLAAERGQSLSDKDARAAVDKAQDGFRDALDDMFPKAQQGKGTKSPRLGRTYTHSFDGVSVTLPGDRVADLLDHDEVLAVWPDAEVKALADPDSPTADASTARSDDDGVTRLHAEGITGKGIKVGIIDTGIDYHHPDLAAAYAGGYDFVDDDNDPMETTYADWKASGQAEKNQGSTYYTEHGTHVAGIVAGRGATDKERAAHGVAPDASVYAYRALGPYGSGSTSDIMAAMDRAAADGMDVVNMSLGAAYNDPLSPQSVAADNLVLAGVTTVIAAGNSGPGTGTLGTPGAAALPLTVGAAQQPITLPSYTLFLGGTKAEGRLLAQPDDNGEALRQLADGSYPLTDVGTGTAAGYTGKNVTGDAVLIHRGGITLDEKVRRAKTNGAAAVLLVNDKADEGHIPNYIGESPAYVPAFSVTTADGAELAAEGADARLTVTAAGSFTLGNGSLADFSSRGPVYGTAAIKPEVTAPGVSVLSSVPLDAVAPGTDDYSRAYARLSGTSMAAPYVAGTAALLVQHDPDLSPDDIKTRMMNTARALPGNVSVFEAGAGGVDPYAAVHAMTALQVPVTTSYTALDGSSTTVDARSGALDFGMLALGRAAHVEKRLRLTNHSGRPITYTADVAFTRGSGSAQDAAAAHVTLTTKDRVTVGARGKAAVDTTLQVPADAPAGYYEGSLTLTPTDGTADTLHVPFGMRVTRTGFDTIDMTKPLASTSRYSDAGSVDNGVATFNLKMAGQLRSVDIFLADSNGKDLGYVGGINTVGLSEGVLYGPATVGPWYFPFTGRAATPIDPRGRWIDDGAYKLRIVGTDAQGGTDTEVRDLYVDSHAPAYEDAYGATNPASPQVVEIPANATSFDVKGTLKDGETDAIRRAGLDIGDADNVLYYGVNSPNSPLGHLDADSEGRVDGTISLSAGPPTFGVKLWPADAAGNIGGIRSLSLIKKGVPYVVGSASTSAARAGDRVTYTLTAHDLNHWKTFSSQIRYDDRNLKLVSVEPTAELSAHGPSALRTTDVSAGASSYRTVAFDVSDADGLTGDAMPLLKVTYEVTNTTFTTSAGLGTGSTSAIGTDGVKVPLNIQFYGGVRMLNPKSTFSARPAAQALLTKNLAYDTARDYSADGFQASLVAPDGTRTDLRADSAARMQAGSLEPSSKPYRFEVAVPGHFTWHEDIDLGLDGDWDVAGTSDSSSAALVAGDVNGDDVIDVRDAALVYAARGTSERAADINHDGTVDAHDMQWVVTNYLQHNAYSDRITDAVETTRGKALEYFVDRM